MKLANIKHQWEGSVYDRFQIPGRKAEQDPMYRLLKYLETLDGPDIWVGSSHSYFNFCARDAENSNQWVPALAFAYATRDPDWYCIEYPIPYEFMPQFQPDYPAEDLGIMTSVYVHGVEMAGQALLSAFAASGNNPARTRASWLWYVCPRCDFHQARYADRCERCQRSFPPEVKMQVTGAQRVAATPSVRIGD